MIDYLVREPKSAIENPSLFLLLHGYGSNEKDLFSFADELPDDAYVISLRAIKKLPMGGYCWYELDLSKNVRILDIEQTQKSQDIILKFIDQIHDKYPFDKNNISLIGFSQGAILSFSLALHNPHKFKKILCLSGYPDPDLLADVDMGSDFSDLEFYFSHGIEDPIIPVQWARQFKSIAEELDLHFEYHEYHQGHGINSENYYDLLNFIQ
ncbi:alpha/beta fold hydrolase [Apibacter muscae]|uniref:alpha/beta hydrolase n=1 Tax=Apibacter muscae TaxID=2509004 RepID=UPI0011ABD97F|nr:alpha/beta fold hydrolase [Apibacter muscae]TWP29972.1 alpha/beta fold hydrolase [Apibacter muscae]